MTNLTGEVFISYNHEQKEYAAELDKRLREHGVPVWRDERKTGAGQLEAQIESVLQGDGLSGAILLVSEDILDSSTILRVEIPQIHSRQNSSDAFFAFLLRSPGLSAGETQEILTDIPAVNDFSGWFFHELQSEDEESPNYTRIVEEIIQLRIETINKGVDPNPIVSSINSQDSPELDNESHFHANLSHYFEYGLPKEEIWNTNIREAIIRLSDQLGSKAGNKILEFNGLAHLSISFTIGSQFPSTRGIHTKWVQRDPNFNKTIWDPTLNAETANLSISSRLKDSSNRDLAVFLSLTDDVRPEVGNTMHELPEFNTIIEIDRSDYSAHITPKQGVEIADEFRRKVREELNSRSNIETIHLFQSSPAGVAFLLGQQTNTLPPIQTYELDETQQPRKYEQSIRIC